MKPLLLIALSLTAVLAAAPPAVGERPPAFTLTNLDGVSKQLGPGPVVLIVLRGFPGYQCPMCNRQVSEFVRSGTEFARAGVRVVMVYPGPPAEVQTKAKEFVSDKNLPQHFELLVDPDYTFTKAYSLRWDAPNETAYPATFIVDKNGKITFAKVSRTHGGRTTAAEVLAALPR